MKPASLSLLCCALSGLSSLAEVPGQATAEWISASPTCEPGKPLVTGVRMVVAPDHHTYWINPGESGMKTSVVWDLPAGWQAGELEMPVPKRFKTGELSGFGYDGTVIYPVKLTPPADFTGPANLKGKLTWLACNDAHCIPGRAEISLQLQTGVAVATEHSEVLRSAQGRVPVAAPGLELDVAEAGENLLLTLKVPANPACDPAASEVFPVTPQVLDSAAEIQFTLKSVGIWTATVRKSEYFTPPLAGLRLVLAGKGTTPPLTVAWEKDKND